MDTAADSGDSAPRISFLGTVRSCLASLLHPGKGCRAQSSAPSQPPGSSCGWLQEAGASHRAAPEALHICISSAPGLTLTWVFQSTSAAVGSAAALVHHAGMRASEWISLLVFPSSSRGAPLAHSLCQRFPSMRPYWPGRAFHILGH